MQIQFETAKQHEIADLLWVAEDEAEVAAVIRKFGKDAVVVREMMIAAAMDDIDDTELAVEILRDL
jgi:threonine dehydratase